MIKKYKQVKIYPLVSRFFRWLYGSTVLGAGSGLPRLIFTSFPQTDLTADLVDRPSETVKKSKKESKIETKFQKD